MLFTFSKLSLLKMKKLQILVVVLLVCHFLLIIINQLDNLNYIKNSKLTEFAERYTNPFFEQNWGMFAPNPPRGNQYVIVKYKFKKDSLVLDIHDKISQNSIFSIFSINQRVLKYQNECYNDIINKLNAKKISFDSINVHKSHGIESLLNYSRFTLYNQDVFLKKVQHNDSVFVDFYLVDEILDKPSKKRKYIKKQYIELKNIFLVKK